MRVLTGAKGTPQISCENEMNELHTHKGSVGEAVSAAAASVALSLIFSHFTLVTVYCAAKTRVI